jgi:hypothetical protein
MKISILEKMRAPSRIAFCEGLDGSPDPQDYRDDHHRNELRGDNRRRNLDAESFLQIVADERPTVRCVGVVLRTKRVFERDERTSEPQELRNDGGRQNDHVDWLVPLEGKLQRNTSQQYGHPDPVEPERGVGQLAVSIHLAPPFLWSLSGKEQFSTALLPERLSSSYDYDNTANIAYMSLKVKPNRKSLYFKAFSEFQYWIKKFSSPKIKIWFKPMFFSGFFCGFERCGFAAFPNFRGGTSSPPQAAKCVRTNSRILHQNGT